MLRNLRELYQYRALVMALVKRHLSSRYRGSLLGFLWSFLNPLCLMLVYMLVFKYYIRFDSVDNYTIFLFCGLLPWLWFSSAVIEGTSSVVSSGHLITKSMFPPQILPAVSVLTSAVHFLLSLPLLFIFMLAYGVEFHLTLVLLPLIAFIQLGVSFGLALALGALNVHFRDVQHIVGNLLTFVFFLCPILYPVSTVPEQFRFTMDYNPLAILTLSYQQVILDGVWPPFTGMVVLALFLVLSLWIGSWIFEKNRESFAELL